MPFFHYNGLKLYYVDVGSRSDGTDGIPLLFIHGAGSSHICWALQLREFSKTNRTIAIDLSGHGESEGTDDEASIKEGYSHEIDALVHHLGLVDFIMIGHSMGGGIAMSYLLNGYEINPTAMVLVDTSPVLELSKLATGLVKETITDQLFLLKSRLFEDYNDTYKIKRYEDTVRLAHPKIMARDLRACDAFDITDRIPELDLPIFVLVGEHDDIITPAMVKEYQSLLPRSDLAIVRDADHSPMIEQPDEFNRLLRDFILWVENNH